MKSASRRTARSLLLLLANLPWMSGCLSSMVGTSTMPPKPDRRAFSVEARADSTSESRAAAHAYRLVSGNPAVAMSDPRFQQVAAYVRAALSTRGLYEAAAGVKPEIEIAVRFEIGPPQVVTRFTVVSGSQDVPEMTHKVKETVKLPDGTKQKVEKEVTVPAHSVSTTNSVPYQVTLFLKSLTLTARPTSAPSTASAGGALWEVRVTNEDEVSSLEASLPLLVAAAMDFLGADLAEPKVVSLRAEDSRVALVKGEPTS